MTEENAVGRTYLYKGKEARIFEGDEVAKMAAAGWKDAPQSKAKRGRPAGSRNKPEERTAEEITLSELDGETEPEAV